MPYLRESPFSTPRRSPSKSPRILCRTCNKWHASVQCRVVSTSDPPQDDLPDPDTVLSSSILELARMARFWKNKAFTGVEYARQIHITENLDLLRQLSDASFRNSQLTEQLEASQLLATNLDTDLRTAQRKLADQDTTICILREECNAARASSATLSARVDDLMLDLSKAYVCLESSRSNVTRLESEVLSLKQQMQESKAATASLSSAYKKLKISANNVQSDLTDSICEISSLRQEVKLLQSELETVTTRAKIQQSKLEDSSFFLRIVDELADDFDSAPLFVLRNVRACFRSESNGLNRLYVELFDHFPIEPEDVSWATESIKSLTADRFRYRDRF